MTLSRALQGSLYGVLLLLAGASTPSTIPLEVEYAGCEAVLLPGPVCRLEPSRELRLWVETPAEAQVEVRAAGMQIDAAGELFQGGERFSLTIPQGVNSVDLLIETPEGQARWSLPLEEPKGETSREPMARQARHEMSRDLLRDISETASPLFEFIQDRRFAAAREILKSLPLPPRAPAELRYHVSYFRGLLAEKEGDYRTALAEIQKTIEIAERVRLEEWQWMAEEKLAMLLSGLGRFREAAELYASLGRTPLASSCKGAQLLVNQAWSSLLAREAGESFEDPTPLFEKALAMYEPCKDFEPDKRVNLLLNLALAHLREDRLTQAKDFLAQARELEDHATLLHTLWWLDLEARIALREERPEEALRLFERLAEIAVGTSSSDGRLRAAFGKARSSRALGDRTAALEAVQKAESLLDGQSFQIPLHQGRETFMATRQAVVSLHIDLLLEEGQTAKALDVARHARSRMLRQLERSDRLARLTPDQRARWDDLVTEYQQKRAALEKRAKDDWRLPLDQLRREQAVRTLEAERLTRLLDQVFLLLGDQGKPSDAALSPPRRGELILAYHPLPHGWAGFAADGKTVMVHRFELPPDLSRLEELSRRLLLPFRSRIEQAKRLRILPSGRLQEIDFNELPFAGDILLASRPIVYGLDLPILARTVRSSGRKALLVTDPRDDLPAASEEARAVKDSLGAWRVEELTTTQASAEAVRDRLITADLLHYVGHGKFSGFGGWDSSLLLAERTRLTLGDLLALERVPAWVVLSACETGRSSTETPVGSLGLAHAFLLAGSQAVVASIRPAKDREMPTFFSELYQEWGREPDLAVALQRAQLSWRRRNSGADWKGFRVFEP
jgi:tetratricopeptide (TPR) repeat protein